MMRARLLALRDHRGLLLARAAEERERMGAAIDRADAATAWIEGVARAVAEARRHPLWIIAGAAFLVALRPRRMLGLLLKGWSLYQVYLRGKVLWDRFAPLVAHARRAR